MTILPLIIILAAAILVYAVIGSKGGPKHTRHGGRRVGGVDRNLVASRWQAIQLMSQTDGSGLKNAISEADKLVDYVLMHSGVPGATMADRLRAGSNRFSDINAIWRAHKLRNALAHEVGFDLVASQAREALRDFERGLRDLGAL